MTDAPDFRADAPETPPSSATPTCPTCLDCGHLMVVSDRYTGPSCDNPDCHNQNAVVTWIPAAASPPSPAPTPTPIVFRNLTPEQAAAELEAEAPALKAALVALEEAKRVHPDTWRLLVRAANRADYNAANALNVAELDARWAEALLDNARLTAALRSSASAHEVHLRRHKRLAEALGMDPGYSADATIDEAIRRASALAEAERNHRHDREALLSMFGGMADALGLVSPSDEPANVYEAVMYLTEPEDDYDDGVGAHPAVAARVLAILTRRAALAPGHPREGDNG